MSMDAGEIKAKVTVEYDGSGVEQAKEDIASLAEMAGSFEVPQISQFAESLASAAPHITEVSRGMQDFGSAVDAIQAPFQASVPAIAQWSEALGGGQQAVIGAAASVQALGAPLSGVSKQFTEASAPMFVIAEHAQSMAEQVSTAGDSFAQIQGSLEQAVPLLPQFASSLHEANGQMAQFGQTAIQITDPSTGNIFSLPQGMQLQFDQSGRIIGDSASYIKDQLNGVNQAAANTGASFATIGESAKGAGAGFATMGDTAQSAGDTLASTGKEFAGTFSAQSLDPAAESMQKLATATEVVGAAGAGESAATKLSGGMSMMGVMNMGMMGMFAAQMITMVVSQVAQGIYTGAAAAEGPAAHTIGSFTGTVDALGQQMQKTSGQFSESFGQSFLPTLNAMNYQASQMQGTGVMDTLGSVLGGTVSFLANVGQIGIGGMLGASIIFGPMGAQMAQSGMEGLTNQFASWFGQPPPYAGPGPASGSTLTPEQIQIQIQTSIAQIPAQLATAIATMNAQSADPAYLAAQARLSDMQARAQEADRAWMVSHPTGSMGPDDPMTELMRQQMRTAQQYGMTGVAGEPTPLACFPAGTRVLMADGSERAIETLEVGDQVMGHDGSEHVPASIMARIVPPLKPVYELRFTDGTRLTLTDSHPIATSAGWKSLAPDETQRENSGLEAGVLSLGDTVYIRSGSTVLIAILPQEGVVPVYNITVSGPHTFYANGVLVHNKGMLSNQITQQLDSIQLPPMTGMTSNIQSSLSSIFSGIHLPSLPDLAGDINSMLGNIFSGIHLPIPPDLNGQINSMLSGIFVGLHLPPLPDITSQIGGELGGLFSGIHLPSLPDVASQISAELGGLFSGIHLPPLPDVASQISAELGGLFSGIHLPSLPDIAGSINGMLSSIFTSVHMPLIPAFASGIEGFSGGLAMVGEAGPELLRLPAGSSVYPMTAGGGFGGNITPISLGGGGGGGGGSVQIHNHISINGRELISMIGPDIAAEIRATMGGRSA